jgi:hypothetical protein
MAKKKYILVTIWSAFSGANHKNEEVAKVHGPFKTRREAEAFHFSHRSLWKAKQNKILKMDSSNYGRGGAPRVVRRNNEDRVKVSS